MRDENQLHAANVELIALENAEIKYSTGSKLVSLVTVKVRVEYLIL
jgi:Fe-S cluster assembly scaffold protein SufB